MQNTFHSEPTEPAYHNPYYSDPYNNIPPPPPRKSRWLHILLVISLLAILGSIVFSVLYMSGLVIPSTLPVSSPIPTSAVSREFITGRTCAGSGPNCSLCAVGVIGHHAVAEFTHPPIFWLADDCKSFEYHSPDYFAEPIPQSGIYWWESMPKVCGTYGTEGTTVYDDGSQEYGIEMCHELGITPYCFQYNIAPTLRCNPTPTAQPTQAPSTPPLPTAPPPQTTTAYSLYQNIVKGLVVSPDWF